MLACVSICAIGCAQQRTVLVPPGEVVKAGPGGLRGRVYVRTAAGWELSRNTVSVPEGWYAVPPEYAK
jgi:hypothetical protein